MPAPSDSHRKHWPILLGQFPGKDNRCVRDVLNWCLCGPDSTRTGVMRIHIGSIAEELGWPKPAVEAAIQTLHETGAAVWSPEYRTLYVGAVLLRSPAQNVDHWKGLARELSGFQSCGALTQAYENLGPARHTVSKTVPETVKDISMQGAGCRVQVAESSDQDLPPASPGELFPDSAASVKESNKPKAEKKAKPEVSEATRRARAVIQFWNVLVDDGDLHQPRAKEDARKNHVLSKGIDTAGGWWALGDLLDWACAVPTWGGSATWTRTIYEWMADDHLRKCMAAFRNANGRDPDPRKPVDEPDSAAPTPIKPAPGCPECGNLNTHPVGHGDMHECKCGNYFTPVEVAA
jgi:hypothetical protein